MRSINLNRFDLATLRLYVAAVRLGSLTAGAARQDRRESAALADLALHLDTAALGLDDPARQRQPEAGALEQIGRAHV